MLIEADFKEASSALTAPPVIRSRRMKVPAGRVRREPGLLSSVCWTPFGEILDRWRRDDGAIACGHVPLSSGTDLSADHRRMGVVASVKNRDWCRCVGKASVQVRLLESLWRGLSLGQKRSTQSLAGRTLALQSRPLFRSSSCVPGVVCLVVIT